MKRSKGSHRKRPKKTRGKRAQHLLAWTSREHGPRCAPMNGAYSIYTVASLCGNKDGWSRTGRAGGAASPSLPTTGPLEAAAGSGGGEVSTSGTVALDGKGPVSAGRAGEDISEPNSLPVSACLARAALLSFANLLFV